MRKKRRKRRVKGGSKGGGMGGMDSWRRASQNQHTTSIHFTYTIIWLTRYGRVGHKTFKCSLSSLLLIFSLQLKISIGMRDNCIQEMNSIKTPISVTYWHVNIAITANPQNKAKKTKEKIP